MNYSFSDEQILEKIQSADTNVLIHLYERNFKTIQSYIQKNSGNREDTEDILSEAVTIFYQNVLSGKFQLSSKIDTYIYSICQNLWLKRLRKDKKIEFNTDKITSFRGIDPHEENEFDNNRELTLIIQKSIDKLGKTCKDILQYFYFEELNNQKIAELVGMNNADTVKAKKYQCMKELEKIVKKDFLWEDLF